MTKNNMEVTLRNADTERLIKETHLINLKPVAFAIAAVLLLIGIFIHGIRVPDKVDSTINKYETEVISNLNSLILEDN